MYSEQFQKALSSGQTLIRRIWKNQSSGKDQYTVQFMQEINRDPQEVSDSGDAESLMIAASQGINPGQRATALRSVSASVLKAKGFPLTDSEFFREGQPVKTGADLFGFELEIQIVENTERNPYSSTQEPKINPTTKEVLKDEKGNPIYRHTSVLPLGSAQNKFMQASQNVREAAPESASITSAIEA